MHVVDIIIFVCWAVFWIYWVVAAFGNKAGQSQWTRFAGVRIGVFLVIFLLVRARVFRGSHSIVSNPWLEGIGMAVFLAGLALAVWARVYLGRNWGMPMTQKQDPELITSGPYRRVRHPIYSGIIVAMTGTAIAVSLYWLVAMALIGAYFIYSATVEERFMAGRFPGTYPEYKRSTKMAIPFVFLESAAISCRDGRVPPVTASRPAVRPAAAGNPHGRTAASRPGRSRRPRSPDP